MHTIDVTGSNPVRPRLALSARLGAEAGARLFVALFGTKAAQADFFGEGRAPLTHGSCERNGSPFATEPRNRPSGGDLKAQSRQAHPVRGPRRSPRAWRAAWLGAERRAEREPNAVSTCSDGDDRQRQVHGTAPLSATPP